MSRINFEKLETELSAAGVPIDGVTTWGEVHYRPEATAQQRAQAAQIVAAHNPTETLAQKRRDLKFRRQEWDMCRSVDARIAYLATLLGLQEAVEG